LNLPGLIEDFACVCWSLVDAMMIAEFDYRQLEQKGNEEAMPMARDHGKRD
jgi:hypothetical protein